MNYVKNNYALGLNYCIYGQDPGNATWHDYSTSHRLQSGEASIDGTHHLVPNSVAISFSHQTLGTIPGGYLTTDLDGNPRIVGTYGDCGCFEYQGTSSIDAVFAEYDDGDIDVDLDFF